MSPLMIGVAMLIHGLVMGAKAMSRLRFFGRGEPANLAHNLTTEQAGHDRMQIRLRIYCVIEMLVFREPTVLLTVFYIRYFRT